jgi:hypothetical protein
VLLAFVHEPNRFCRSRGIPLDNAVRHAHDDARGELLQRARDREGGVECMPLSRRAYRDAVDTGSAVLMAEGPKSIWALYSSLQRATPPARKGAFHRLAVAGWVAVGTWSRRTRVEVTGLNAAGRTALGIWARWTGGLPSDTQAVDREPRTVTLEWDKASSAVNLGALRRVLRDAGNDAAKVRLVEQRAYFYHRLVRRRPVPPADLPPAAATALMPVYRELALSITWPWLVCDLCPEGCRRFTIAERNVHACFPCRRRLSSKARWAVRSGRRTDLEKTRTERPRGRTRRQR